MLKQLFQVLSISIISGADGPTSIYVSSAYLWQFLLCVIALIVFGIYRLIKNIKKNNWKGYLLCFSSAIISLIVILILLIAFIH